jgi:hypothetical protein
VVTNSPAHNKLFPGDGVAAIEGRDTSSMKHEDAQNLIRNSLRLQFVLRRYVSEFYKASSCFYFSGQLNTIKPSRPPVKFGPGPPQHVNSALHNTTTPNNYRRF